MNIEFARTIASAVFFLILIVVVSFFSGWKVGLAIFAFTFGLCFIYIVLTVFIYWIGGGFN